MIHLLWSTCHSPTAPGVSTRMGLTERAFNRKVLAGVNEACSRMDQITLYDLIDSAPMNWRRAAALAKSSDRSLNILLVEVHLNSNGLPTLDGWKSGTLIEYHKDHPHMIDLASRLSLDVSRVCPPHREIGLVAQPGSPLYNRDAMFEAVPCPAVLIEPGLIQDPAFSNWADSSGGPAELGRELVQTIFEFYEEREAKC